MYSGLVRSKEGLRLPEAGNPGPTVPGRHVERRCAPCRPDLDLAMLGDFESGSQELTELTWYNLQRQLSSLATSTCCQLDRSYWRLESGRAALSAKSAVGTLSL